MHKKTLKRNTLRSLTQKTRAESSRLRNHESNEDESNDHFQLPSLQTKKIWKDNGDRVPTRDGNSTASFVSHSTEMENIATTKVIQQWEVMESTLYEDGEQVTHAPVLEECVQWRTQVPHLRILGKNPFLSEKTKYQDLSRSSNQVTHSFDSDNEEVISEHSASLKEEKSSSRHKFQRMPEERVLDILFEYVISELSSNKTNEIDSLSNNLNEALQIRGTSVHSSKSSTKSMKSNCFEETISLENKFSNNKGKMIEDLQLMKENGRLKSERDALSALEDKLFRPHTSRNKLGTVFNEKIVVSPVPYILSTRESFSTVKTTPIKYMGQALNVSTFQGSSRNVSYLGKYSTSAKMSNYQSAWHAPVSPGVWPRNIKLAPLDTSRLPSSKNRSVTSSSIMPQRNRKPLSPISRSSLPASAQIKHNSSSECLEIQGRHIIPGQSSRISVSAIGPEYNPANGKIKRKKGCLRADGTRRR